MHAGAMRSLGCQVRSNMRHEASLGIGRQYSIKCPATMLCFNCHTSFLVSSRLLAVRWYLSHTLSRKPYTLAPTLSTENPHAWTRPASPKETYRIFTEQLQPSKMTPSDKPATQLLQIFLSTSPSTRFPHSEAFLPNKGVFNASCPVEEDHIGSLSRLSFT